MRFSGLCIISKICCEVTEKAIQLTVSSAPKENAVVVKINITELRSRHAKFIFNRNNNRIGYRDKPDFGDVCFHAIMRPVKYQ